MIINGRPFIDIVTKIEEAIENKNFSCPAGEYNYLSPKDLYYWLKLAGTDSDSNAFLLCCPECDEEGCASVTTEVEYTPDSVIWKNFGNMYEHEFEGLQYEFKRSDYEAFMNKLKQLAENERNKK